ncbi:lipid-A-disaccharide synthase [Psychrobium sp. MM17-31]|uniref:lipid-A-disaccharide synthase n=1 Tax=Psychrobium sp. MM17-31 TaxID=2917758 RepID=UPI001EF5A573|nr:lipid-A-disaccharide synthase [Psychrobium sp. MM17-31]
MSQITPTTDVDLIPIRIGIVAGEISGDILGASFIKSIKKRYPNAVFEGIGGPQMIEQGCHSLFDMEELSVMGLVEVFSRLRRLFAVKRALFEHFTANPPDVFVGIDAPDFNLRLELQLKEAGIKTVQYVSPSIWAWRQKRIFKVAKATNLVLALLPFEKEFYDKYDFPCDFVGHTLADQIAPDMSKQDARDKLGLELDAKYLALMPGSRGSELKYNSQMYLEAALRLKEKYPELRFVIPLVNEQRKAQFLAAKAELAPNLDIAIIDGQSRDVMAASDVIMLASGTATLEGLLVNRPMVVVHKIHWLTYKIFKPMMKVEHYSLPNLLAKKELIVELIQDDATIDNIVTEASKLLDSDNQAMLGEFSKLQQLLKCDASERAADSVLGLIKQK